MEENDGAAPPDGVVHHTGELLTRTPVNVLLPCLFESCNNFLAVFSAIDPVIGGVPMDHIFSTNTS